MQVRLPQQRPEFAVLVCGGVGRATENSTTTICGQPCSRSIQRALLVIERQTESGCLAGMFKEDCGFVCLSVGYKGGKDSSYPCLKPNLLQGGVVVQPLKLPKGPKKALTRLGSPCECQRFQVDLPSRSSREIVPSRCDVDWFNQPPSKTSMNGLTSSSVTAPSPSKSALGE